MAPSAEPSRPRKRRRSSGRPKPQPKVRRPARETSAVAAAELPVAPAISAEEALLRVEALENDLRSRGVRAANALPSLLSLMLCTGAVRVRALHAARRTISALVPLAAADKELSSWLDVQRVTFGKALGFVVGASDSSEETRDAAVAVAAVMGGSCWNCVVKAALDCENEDVLNTIGDAFLRRFGELRAGALMEVGAGHGSVQRRLKVLQWCSEEPERMSVKESGKEEKTGDEKDGALIEKGSWKKKIDDTWRRLLLDTEISEVGLCEALRQLPKYGLCAMKDPLKLADFLTDCYNGTRGPDVSVASLDALFVLISKHGLDYPLFYTKLYALLTPRNLFHASHNARFLELTGSFLLYGEFLPGALIAAFIKRLCRRALVAPPAGAMWCLRLSLDLLYKHPAVSYLVHRSVSLFDKPPAIVEQKKKVEKDNEKWQVGHGDPYDDDELDPQASHADESSLWELEALRTHISPAVSRLVTAFSKDVRKRPLPPPGDLKDYANLTFADVFETEFKRRAKATPIAYDPPGNAPGVKEVIEDVGNTISWY